MNYKEMLDQFEFLDKKLAHLELEARYLNERIAKLEGVKPIVPKFTEGTVPNPWPVNLPATTEFNSLAKFDFNFKNLNNPKGTPNES